MNLALEPTMAEPRVAMTVGWLVLFVVIASAIAGVRVLKSWAWSPLSRPVAQGNAIPWRREFLWLLVPCTVLATFGLTTSPREFLSALGVDREPGLSSPPPVIPPTAPNGAVIPVSTDDRSAAASDAPTRPTWCDRPRSTDGDAVRVVLVSRQYSTRAEAEQELQHAAVSLVKDDLRVLQTGAFRPAHWQPRAEDVIEYAVKQRHAEVVERDFGSFFHPMHRVWWQVELSPAVRTEFAPAWRRELISFRILFVASVASLCAMAASAGVMSLRLDTLTQGRSRGKWKLLAGGLTAGWWVCVASLFSQGHWW